MVYPLPMLRSIGVIASLVSFALSIGAIHEVPISSGSYGDFTLRVQAAQLPQPFYLIAHRVLMGKVLMPL